MKDSDPVNDPKINCVIQEFKDQFGNLPFMAIARFNEEDLVMFGSATRTQKLDLLASAMAQLISENGPEEMMNSVKEILQNRGDIASDDEDFTDKVRIKEQGGRKSGGLLDFIKDKLRKDT